MLRSRNLVIPSKKIVFDEIFKLSPWGFTSSTQIYSMSRCPQNLRDFCLRGSDAGIGVSTGFWPPVPQYPRYPWRWCCILAHPCGCTAWAVCSQYPTRGRRTHKNFM